MTDKAPKLSKSYVDEAVNSSAMVQQQYAERLFAGAEERLKQALLTLRPDNEALPTCEKLNKAHLNRLCEAFERAVAQYEASTGLRVRSAYFGRGVWGGPSQARVLVHNV